jgi:inorganic pyrophosphatase
MEDEKGVDEKVLCVLKDDYHNIHDIEDLSNEMKNNISDFFKNYKTNTEGKWSVVGDFINKPDAIRLYNKYKLK